MAPEAGRAGNPTLVVASTQRGPTTLTTLQPVDTEVRNRNLLNTMFEFKKGAQLKHFIIEKTHQEKRYYSLAEVLTVLKDVISAEKMFDERNPSVIICSKSLEQALNQKALHVTEVRDLVLGQLERLADQSLRDRGVARPGPAPPLPGPPQTAAPRVIRTASVATNVQTNKDAKFRLKPLFLKVAQMVEGVTKTKTIFTYEEVTLILSKYILSKKETLFDQRNIKLAIVKGDPLGEAFGVDAFHRCQVNALLRTQLLPVHPDSQPHETSTTTTSSLGVSVRVAERSVPVISSSSTSTTIPPFPALQKANSLPAALSTLRKRSNSSDDGEESKRSRRSGNCSVIVRKSGDSEVETDTETIYSEQGYETIKATEEEGEDVGTSGSDMDTTRETFDVEYDIDSGEEEMRPPQAGGRGQDFSSCNNSDSDIDLGHRSIAPAAKGVFESVYWADSEEEKDEQVAELRGQKKVWKCISCKTPNKPLITHCNRCWESRKAWAPERPKKKKRKNGKKKEVKRTTELPVDDTDGGSTEADRPRSDTMSSLDSGIGSQEMDSLDISEDLGETEITMEPAPAPASLDLTPINRCLSLNMSSKSSSSSGSIASIDVSDLSELGSICEVKPGSESLCMFCLVRPRDTTFIHGRLGHQVCCYPCAKKHWKTSPSCPICKRKVEKFIKVIQA